MPSRNSKIVLILSGQIASGKSTLANKLAEKYGFTVLSTRDALITKANREHGDRKVKERGFLQKYGEELDKSTAGTWVCDYYQSEIRTNDFVVIESARILPQIHALRKAYDISVVHIHLTASDNTLMERYIHREESDEGNNKTRTEIEKKYIDYKRNSTEQKVEELKSAADLVVSVDKKGADDVLVQVSSFLRLLSSINTRLVDVVVGAQFGSEGKGQIVGYLAPDYDCLVRVGGPNAGHKVFNVNEAEVPTPDVFHIIPSGAVRNPKATIILGAGTVINEDTLLGEISKFGIDDPSRLIIDENAIIISKKNIDYEIKHQRIGSTAQGVGHATANNILMRLKKIDNHKAKNNRMLKQYIGSAHAELEKLFSQKKKILLEGTQGTFLSLHHGMYPYVTSRDTTVSGCLSEAGIAPLRVRKIIMVTRTYPIRVQSPEDVGLLGHSQTMS